MNVACPICQTELDLPAEAKSRPVQPVDGTHTIYLEVDAGPLRGHLIDTHGGPNGDGGEPLPIPRSA